MGLNPIEPSEHRGGSTNRYNWNYSNKDKDNYSTELVGTVVGMQEVQAMKWGKDGPTSEYDFWDDEHTRPKMLIRLIFAMPDKSIKTFAFPHASRAAREGKSPSVHMDLFKLTDCTDMRNLIGHTLRITTVEPPEGFGYSKGHPRPWKVELADEEGTYSPMSDLPEEFTDPYLTGAKFEEIRAKQQAAQDAELAAADDIPF